MMAAFVGRTDKHQLAAVLNTVLCTQLLLKIFETLTQSVTFMAFILLTSLIQVSPCFQGCIGLVSSFAQLRTTFVAMFLPLSLNLNPQACSCPVLPQWTVPHTICHCRIQNSTTLVLKNLPELSISFKVKEKSLPLTFKGHF